MIELIASSTSLTKRTSVHDPITTGQLNAIKVRFVLEDIWRAVQKTAVFTDGKATVMVLDTKWEGDACLIPPEVCTTAGREIKVGLIGVNGGTQIVPTIWCAIGTVQKGANQNGDPSANKTLPIWAQVIVQLDEIASPVTTSLEKYKTRFDEYGNKDKKTFLRVHFNGITEADTDVSLQLFVAARRRGNKFKWYAPANFDSSDINATKMGYGMLAGTRQTLAETNQYRVYPSVPPWMPNGGYMQTLFKLTETDRSRGYIDIDVAKWAAPLAKPKIGVGDSVYWDEPRFMGMSYMVGAPLYMKFIVKRNGVYAGDAKNILRLGIIANPEMHLHGTDWLVDGDDGYKKINTSVLYVSIG